MPRHRKRGEEVAPLMDESEGGPLVESASQEVEAPQRRRTMIMRENIMKAGVTEDCPGCKAAVSGGNIGAQWQLEEAMKGELEAAERLTRTSIKRTGAPSENESASNNEKGKEIANQERDQKRVRFEPPVAASNEDNGSSSSSSSHVVQLTI